MRISVFTSFLLAASSSEVLMSFSIPFRVSVILSIFDWRFEILEELLYAFSSLTRYLPKTCFISSKRRFWSPNLTKVTLQAWTLLTYMT